MQTTASSGEAVLHHHLGQSQLAALRHGRFHSRWLMASNVSMEIEFFTRRSRSQCRCTNILARSAVRKSSCSFVATRSLCARTVRARSSPSSRASSAATSPTAAGILEPGAPAVARSAAWAAARGQLPLLVALPFAINLVANLVFTPIQIGMRNLPLAPVDIPVVWGTIVWMMLAIWPHARLVAAAAHCELVPRGTTP